MDGKKEETAASGEAPKKLSLKELRALKGAGTKAVAEFKPEEKAEASKPAPEPEKGTRAWMIHNASQQRWESHKVEYEKLSKEAYEERHKLYSELLALSQSGIPMNEDQQYNYSVLFAMYRAINETLPLEELEGFKEQFYKEDFALVMANYLKNRKLQIFDKDKNFDEFDNVKEQIEARFNPKTQEKEAKKVVKKPQAQVAAPPAPQKIAAPAKKAIVFKPEEKTDQTKLKEWAKEKNIAVPDDTKEPMVMIFIGHVDSGKSTIAGNLLILSNKIDQLEISRLKDEASKLNRESWYVAYINDVLQEEKERGKTIEMGRVDIELERKRFTIFDCPGHRTYTQNMMTGAAQADVACLIISAKSGEFEAGFEREGQTREHAMLARAVGVTRLVLVVNKMDSVDWSQERFEHIKSKLTTFLTRNCGFDEKELFWVIVSAMKGVFIKEVPEPNPAPWYTGKTLLETLDNLPPIIRSKENFLRIPVLDKLKDEGELSIYGKVENGLARVGMSCVLMPSMKTFTVSAIERGEGDKLGFAGPGESVRLIVKGIEEEEIKRGQVICGTQFWSPVCKQFEAEIRLFQLTTNMTVTAGFDFVMHLHTLMEEATIHKVISKVTFEDHQPKSSPAIMLKSGETGIVRVKLRQPVCVEKFMNIPQMGRFVMRKESTTIAAGIITRVKVLNEETLKNNNFFLNQFGPDVPDNKEETKPVELFPVGENDVGEDGDDLM